GFVLVKDETGQVRKGRVLKLINADEFDVRVLLGRVDRRRSQEEPDGHDHVVAVGDELVDVVGVIRRSRGLNELDVGEAQVLLSALHAFPGGLVEATVVNLADIGDQTNANLLGVRHGIVRATGIRCRSGDRTRGWAGGWTGSRFGNRTGGR